MISPQADRLIDAAEALASSPPFLDYAEYMPSTRALSKVAAACFVFGALLVAIRKEAGWNDIPPKDLARIMGMLKGTINAAIKESLSPDPNLN